MAFKFGVVEEALSASLIFALELPIGLTVSIIEGSLGYSLNNYFYKSNGEKKTQEC